jgi:hypothetical protein
MTAWDDWYDALVRHGEETGSCDARRETECQLPNGKVGKLGEWLHTQRRHKTLGILKPDRLKKLQVQSVRYRQTDRQTRR